MNPKLEILWETVKDFLRWAVSFFIGWIIDNGYSFFAKSKLDPQIVLAIGVAFKYADYYWHKYNKATQTTYGESKGIIPF